MSNNNNIRIKISDYDKSQLDDNDDIAVANSNYLQVPNSHIQVCRLDISDLISPSTDVSTRAKQYDVLLSQFLNILNEKVRYERDMFRELVHSKDFLELLFRLFDHNGDNQLNQDHWIEFLKERLCNEKELDFAEQIESVAYVLCGDEFVSFERFYQIFHAKGIAEKIFRLLDKNNVGTVSVEQIMEFITNITNSRPRAGFDKKSLESLEQLFRQTVGCNGTELRREQFQKIVISKNPFFTERVFQIFDRDNSGSISWQEFLESMHQFAGQTADDKIKFLFKIYDIDGDGLIQHRELQHVIRACMDENGMQFSEEQIDHLTAAMFEDADTNKRGAITYEALKHQLGKHGGLIENLTISIDRWLVPPPSSTKSNNNNNNTNHNRSSSFIHKLKTLRPYQLSRPYLRNNYVFLTFMAIYFLVNFTLFLSRAIQYRHANSFTILARACGQCLNFNCMFILVLMLRHCITFLRTRGFSAILPLDHHIYLHKMVGMVITFFSLFHTLMHLLNFSTVIVYDPKINAGNFTVAEWLLTDRPRILGLIPGWANPTGFLLLIILIIMFICSQPFVRRGGCFEIFYWTHLLYIPFWILLILHGPNFWKWFIIPGLAYLFEYLLRLVWMQSKRGKTYISSGLLLPSRVTHLVIKRPLHFDFHPGDYIFVNVPSIAKYEWHPLTISSAPEQEDYLWLHIRAVGEWTNRLYEYFECEQEKLHNGQTATANDSTLKRLQASFLKRKRTVDATSASDGDLNKTTCSSSSSTSSIDAANKSIQMPVIDKKPQQQQRLHQLLFREKVPLEKSLSLPNIQTKTKKRERLMVLREYMRSESERSFDECQIRRARLRSLGLAYLSPQNKSLAQSFRYVRNKPTIIAFKTPSLENCETSSIASTSITINNPNVHKAEEGTLEGPPMLKPMNYPVGKPLKSIPEDQCIMIEREEEREEEELVPLISLMPISPLISSGTEVTMDIYLDGPYGTPSSHIFRAQHAVLIATGIGVTPFASILQSIMHRYWKARHTCPKCKYAWASEIPAGVMNLRKVDFFWINRDQRSFEWFVNLLSQLEIEQAELGGAMERFLDMHMYITSALQKTDMKAVGLQLALDLLHEKEKRDLITGLKTRTNAGRPNWDKVFKQLQDQKKGKVTLFYCGPAQLGRILRHKCDQHGFHFRKETF